MSIQRQQLFLAVIALAASPLARAEVDLGTLAGSKVGFEGLVQYDSNWFDNDLADLDGNVNGDDQRDDLRRVELVLKGKGPGDLDWVVGYDAKGDKFLDVNLRLRMGEEGRHFLQLGQFKQPNSLEELSSTRTNDFISKATATNTFAIARRLGVGYGYGGEDWTLSGSWFGRELTSGLASGAGYGMRGTWAPIQGDGRLLHLGLAHVDHDTDADTLRLRARPNADLARVRLVDSGRLVDTDRVATSSAEALWASGPLKLQGEYYLSRVSRYSPGTADYAAHGSYVSGLWNLTGETWGYKAGVVTTPKPSRRGGMWQAGLRYDRLDLDNGQVGGGTQEAWTAGLNWYYGSHFKLMLNHVRIDSQRRGVSDDPSIWEARGQVSW